MPGPLDGSRIAIVTSNTGVEHDELVIPRDQLRERGAQVVHAAVKAEPVHTFRHDLERADTIEPDTGIDGLEADDIDLLIVPGGTVNADNLRTDAHARRLVQALTSAGKPIAAICHGPWLLIDAEVVSGRTLTSYPSLRTDLTNAGGTWVDQPVVRTDEKGWTLITSRNPHDLPDFVDTITAALTDPWT